MESQIYEDPKGFAANHNLPDFKFQPGHDERTSRTSAVINCLPDKAIVIYAEEINGRWIARSISGNAIALLYGHNGRLIVTDAEFTAFLCRFFHIVSKFIDPRDHPHIIPGGKESDSFWSSLEIPFHSPDPDGSLFPAFRNMRHPLIRKKGSHYEGETITLLGKHRKFQLYRKDLEMKRELKKFNGTSDPVLRFELRLSGKELPGAFPERNLRLINGTKRLVSFTLSDLQSVFQEFASGLQGVFCSHEGADPVKDGIARFIATLAAEHNLSVADLVDKYAAEKSLKKERAAGLRKEALRHLQTLIAIDPAELFGQEAWLNQPVIEVPGLEAPLKGMVARYAYADADITRAYTVQTGHFMPRPNL